MDQAALKLIQDTAISNAGGYLDALDNSELIALPTDHVIHSLEKYRQRRSRFRGTFLTDSLSDFVLYVLTRPVIELASAPGQIVNIEPRPSGFINADNLAATVLFNLGTTRDPGHADDVATLKLKPTAPYAAVTAINGRGLLQRDALDWLEDWSEHITYVDESGADMRPAAAIAALRQITIRATSETTSSEDQFRAKRSALEDVEARGAHSLPHELRFTCEPHNGLPTRQFRLRVGVLTNSDKPTLVLRVRNLEAEKEAIAQDFKRVLLTELGEKVSLVIGTFTP